MLRLDGTPLGFLVQATLFLSLLALPAAGIHGILRYGAYDVADADRARLVVRSSSAVITVLYGIGVTAPALLLFDQLQTWGAVTLTALTAVVLLPVRGWMQRLVQRTVLGDRDHHLVLLSDLGARLEQAMELDDVLMRLADGVRRGLDASWVRVSVLGPGGEMAAVPAVVGDVVGDAVATEDLVRGTERLGRLELGPRRHGSYDVAELALLGTVARQATTTVANVRLTARLGEQLDELTASRMRLITAQDEERRRIERNLHDGIQQSVVALIASLGLARQRLQRDELRPSSSSSCRTRRARCSPTCASWPTASTRRSSPTAGSWRPWSRGPPGSRSPSPCSPTSGLGPHPSHRTSRRSPSTRFARRWPTSPSTPAPAVPRCRCRWSVTGCGSRSSTTAPASAPRPADPRRGA